MTPETKSKAIKGALVEELAKTSLGNKVIAFDGMHIYTITLFPSEYEKEYVIELNEGASEDASRSAH